MYMLMGMHKKILRMWLGYFACTCHTLLFPTETTVKWVYLERDEDLEKLNGYNWCAAIVNELLASIQKHHHQPKKVSGCVMVLLYWLCEHTNLVESQFPNATPAFVKWSIPSLTRKFNTASFKNLNRTQVVTGLPNVMVPSSLEILINVVCAEENQIRRFQMPLCNATNRSCLLPVAMKMKAMRQPE